jgi:hypothetical protein
MDGRINDVVDNQELMLFFKKLRRGEREEASERDRVVSKKIECSKVPPNPKM